jgi:hypothetical protein
MKVWIKEQGAVIGYALCIAAFVCLVWVCFSFGSSPQLNILFLLSGGSIGWILGIFITPTSADEKSNFSQYGKTITSFITGFLLAKIEKIFDLIIKERGDLSDVFVLRSLLLIVSFALGILCTFIWRSYVATDGNNKVLLADTTEPDQTTPTPKSLT